MSDTVGEELIERLREALRFMAAALGASCECDTKSPDLRNHVEGCRYRNIATAIEKVQTVIARLSDKASMPVAWVVKLKYGPNHWSGPMLTDVLPSDTDTYKVVQPLYASPPADELREALKTLYDAFLSRHGCFPLDRVTVEQRQWNDAMLKASSALQNTSSHMSELTSLQILQGWRESDWPSWFDRRTAQALADYVTERSDLASVPTNTGETVETAAQRIRVDPEDVRRVLGDPRIGVSFPVAPSTPTRDSAEGREKIIEAARAIIETRSETYRARNNRQVSLQDENGEKMWIVPFDEMADLERALSQQTTK